MAATIVVMLASAPSLMSIDRPPNVYTEMPPVIMPSGVSGVPIPPAPACGWNGSIGAFWFSTGYSSLCVSPSTNLPLNMSGVQPPLAVTNYTTPVYGFAIIGVPPAAIPADTDWRRNYYGVFSADSFVSSLDAAHLHRGALEAQQRQAAPPSPWTVIAAHGENNNQLWNDQFYQNTVNTDVPVRTCYSGWNNGTYQDCMAAYNAFAGLLLVNASGDNCYGVGGRGVGAYYDLGPVAWPLPGYRNATGGKATYGLRHPSVLVGFDSAVYVTYMENTLTGGQFYTVRSAAGPYQGLPMTFAGLNASSLQWEIPALPLAFNVSNVSASFDQPAPGAAWRAPTFPIDDSVEAGLHMAVARMPSLNGYLAVISSVNWTACASRPPHASLRAAMYQNASELCDGAFWQLSLRVSADMMFWSPPTYLSQYGAGSLDAAYLRYPILLNAEGSSQTDVDPSGFFILGTCNAPSCAQTGNLGPATYAAYVSIVIVH